MFRNIPKKNRVILWIPTLKSLCDERISGHLKKASNEQCVFCEHLFYPTEVSPQGFPFHQRIVLTVDPSLGFTFKDLDFEGTPYHGIYNISENSLMLPVELMNVNTYSLFELAQYFKQCWMINAKA